MSSHNENAIIGPSTIKMSCCMNFMNIVTPTVILHVNILSTSNMKYLDSFVLLNLSVRKVFVLEFLKF